MKNAGITKADFRLLRLIFLDSYSKGGEVIVDLSDGAILTGGNGVGKTSLLNVIPAFYGEHPSKCVSGSESFHEFYLSRPTSYVIFEYMRRDVPCMAVLFGINEGSCGYRFIRSAYDRNLFTENEDRSALIQSKDIKLQLKTAGVSYSDQLTHKDYRSVIQGIIAVAGGRHKEGAERRALVSEYSFTNSGSQLRHIDKIVTGMFSRKANFDDFLQVIVDYISVDGNATIGINGDRETYEDWPRKFAAYNEVMTHASRMIEVEALWDKIKTGEGALSILNAKMSLLGKHLTVQQNTAEKNKSNLSATLDAERISAHESLNKIQFDESKAGNDAKIIEDRVAAIDIRSRKYKDADIDKKAAQVDTIQVERELLSIAAGKKDALLGESSKIEHKYQAMELDIGGKHVNHKESLLTEKARMIEQYSPRLIENQSARFHTGEQIQSASDAKLNGIQNAINKAIEEMGRFENAVANPVANEAVVHDFARKRDELESLHVEIRETHLTKDKLRLQQAAAISEYTKQESSLLDLRGRKNNVEKDIRQRLSHLNPEETSMLSFLRENKPEWTETIAKVVREDILVMPGLHPFIDGGNSLYGIQIDLSQLESSICANEMALQEELNALRAEDDVLRAKVIEAEGVLSKRNDARIAADDAARHHDAGITILYAKEKMLKADFLAADRAVEMSRKKAKDENIAKLAEAKSVIKEYEREKERERQSLLSDKKSCAEKYGGIEASILKDKGVEVAGIQAKIDRADADNTATLKQLAADKNKALSDGGVDMPMKQRIDEEITARTKRIRDAESWMKEVADWRFWQDGEGSNRDSLALEAAKLRVNQVKLGENRKLASTRLMDRQKELTDSILAVSGQIDNLASTWRQIQTNITRLEAYPPDRQTMASLFDTSWTINNLMGQVMTLEKERKELKPEMEKHIRAIKSAFASVSARGTPIEQFYLRIRSEVDPDDSDLTKWVKPMQDWFNHGHKGELTILIMAAETYGSLVGDFYKKLVTFQGKVSSFNKAIQDTLNQTNYFYRISNIVIHFKSDLTKLKYWGDLEAFIKAHKEWGYTSIKGMPSPEFSDCLKRLVGHWGKNEGISVEPHKLINICGEVVENGKLKSFYNKIELDKLSSNGLSYLILCSIFVAFLSKIRGEANVQITWAVDELLDLELQNIQGLLAMLKDNGIVLFSACPEANLNVLQQFSERYQVQRVNDIPKLAKFNKCTYDMEDSDV